MYTAKITDKKIVEQYDHVIFTVELTSNESVTPERNPDKPPKLDKDGKEKPLKPLKPRFPTKTIYFKYKLPVTLAQIKKDIKDRIKSIEDIESMDVEMNKTLDLSKV